MRITHIAMWVKDIDTVAAFYERYFDARPGDRYRNPRKQFESRFLAFADGARLELMHRPDVAGQPGESLGYAHLALSVGSEAAVDALTVRLAADGVRCLDGPRRTGDGYYESVVLDPEGNRVEITA